MTAPAIAPPQPAPVPPWGAPPPSPERPGGVTFACVASIVYGVASLAIGLLGFLSVLLFASVLSQFGMGPWGWGGWPFAMTGAFAAVAAFFILVVFVPAGVLGLIAGIHGLRGASWARWTMVALFGLGAVTMLPSVMAGIPLLFVGVNVVAIVMLMNAPANEWFGSVRA